MASTMVLASATGPKPAMTRSQKRKAKAARKALREMQGVKGGSASSTTRDLGQHPGSLSGAASLPMLGDSVLADALLGSRVHASALGFATRLSPRGRSSSESSEGQQQDEHRSSSCSLPEEVEEGFVLVDSLEAEEYEFV